MMKGGLPVTCQTCAVPLFPMAGYQVSCDEPQPGATVICVHIKVVQYASVTA